MRLLIALILTLLAGSMTSPAIAETTPTDIDSVRTVCASTEPRDFSEFDQEALPGILILIIENDPKDAESHDAVMAGALAALAMTKVPEAVPELTEQSDKYPMVCLPLLGDFADGHAVYAILACAVHKDREIRLEAAKALSKLPAPSDKTQKGYKEYVVSLETAIAVIASVVTDEEDREVEEALWTATTHLMEISLQFGMVGGEFADDWSQEDKIQEKYK